METEHLNTTPCEPNTACNGQGMPYFCNSVPVLTTLSLLDLETLDFTSVIEDFVRYSCLLQTNIYHICLLKVLVERQYGDLSTRCLVRCQQTKV